jgi:hypothetical protein
MNFYVYLHRKASNGEVFYVGKGCGHRAWSRNGRSSWWNRIAAKHGLMVDIVIDGIQEWYAFEHEAELISLYGRRNINQGPLINLSDGGEGPSGVIVTAETRIKMSESRKNMVFSEKHRENLSKACKGKVLTESTRTKMSDYRKGRPHHNQWKNNLKTSIQKVAGKKIVRQDGVVFDSYLDAARSVTDDPTKYASVATALGNLVSGKRKQQTVCGYTWSGI